MSHNNEYKQNRIKKISLWQLVWHSTSTEKMSDQGLKSYGTLPVRRDARAASGSAVQLVSGTPLLHEMKTEYSLSQKLAVFYFFSQVTQSMWGQTVIILMK